MKSIYISLLLLFIFSCGSNQTTVNNTQTSTSNPNKNIDCSEDIKEYIRNNQGLITKSTERYIVNSITKQSDGSYNAQLQWEDGSHSGGYLIKQFWTNNNCDVIKIK